MNRVNSNLRIVKPDFVIVFEFPLAGFFVVDGLEGVDRMPVLNLGEVGVEAVENLLKSKIGGEKRCRLKQQYRAERDHRAPANRNQAGAPRSWKPRLHGPHSYAVRNNTVGPVDPNSSAFLAVVTAFAVLVCWKFNAQETVLILPCSNIDICTDNATISLRSLGQTLPIRTNLANQSETASGLGRINHFLPSICPKITPFIYTVQSKTTRENAIRLQSACATCRVILGQTHHVADLSNKYFAREFTRFSRAQLWRSCQIVSQNSLRFLIPLPRPSGSDVGFALRVVRSIVSREPTPCPQTIRLRIARIPDE
jgi:hypothetical protein